MYNPTVRPLHASVITKNPSEIPRTHHSIEMSSLRPLLPGTHQIHQGRIRRKNSLWRTYLKYKKRSLPPREIYSLSCRNYLLRKWQLKQNHRLGHLPEYGRTPQGLFKVGNSNPLNVTRRLVLYNIRKKSNNNMRLCTKMITKYNTTCKTLCLI